MWLEAHRVDDCQTHPCPSWVRGGGSSSTYPYIHITIVDSYSVRGCTSAYPTLSHETSFAQMCVWGLRLARGAVMSGLVNPCVNKWGGPKLPTPASIAYWTIGMCGAGKRDCRWRCVSECIKELQTVRCIGCSWDLGFLLPIMLGI